MDEGGERFLPSGLVISDIHPECSQKGNFCLRLQSGEGAPWGSEQAMDLIFPFPTPFFSFCKLCRISFISCRQRCLFLKKIFLTHNSDFPFHFENGIKKKSLKRGGGEGGN